MAVLIYEASHDLLELLGKDFRSTLETFPLTENDWRNLNEITKALNQFKKENRIFLKNIRNFSAAHREQDAIKQLEIIEKVELLEIVKVGGEFYKAIRPLIDFITRVMTMMSDWRVIVQHMPFDSEEA
jgi:hypothetical protein